MSDPEALADAWARGSAHWAFSVPLQAFGDAAACSDAADGPDFDAVEMYLAAGCQLALPDALHAFDKGYVAKIPPTLRRQGFSPDQIDEAMQRVRTDLLVPHAGESMIRLCRYAGTGRLASLVRVSATRYARRVDRTPGEPIALAEFWMTEDHAGSLVASELGLRFKASFAEALAQFDARDKVLLRMVFVESLSYREVAELMGVSKSTVCRQLVDIERRLVKQLTAAWRRETKTPLADDLGEIIAGELDLSFSRLLRET